jgi:osmotically inducible lipoprotein OsmB
MRTFLSTGIMALAAVSLGACAEYRNNETMRGAGRGAAIGAVGGAVVGAVVDGVSPIEGAVAGAVAGGAVGALTAKGRRWMRDDQGNCYYLNSRHAWVYDRRRSC